MSAGIYKIVNNLNGRIYVGSSGVIEQRRRRHFLDLKKGIHRSRFLQRDFSICGVSAFQFAVIENIDASLVSELRVELLRREQYWIDKLDPPYNLERIAGSSVGVKHCQEAVEANRARNTGYGNGNAKLTDELLSWSVDARASMTVRDIAFALDVDRTSLQRGWKRIGIKPAPKVFSAQLREKVRVHAVQILLPSRRRQVAILDQAGAVGEKFISVTAAAKAIGASVGGLVGALKDNGGRIRGYRLAYLQPLGN